MNCRHPQEMAKRNIDISRLYGMGYGFSPKTQEKSLQKVSFYECFPPEEQLSKKYNTHIYLLLKRAFLGASTN